MRAGVRSVPLAVVGNEGAMPIVYKASRLAKLMNLPYVPVTVNMFVFGPVLGLVVPLPSKFRIRVLPPVYFDAAPNQERNNRGLILDQAEEIPGSVPQARHAIC